MSKLRIRRRLGNSDLRERCEAKLAGIEIPVPFTIDAFCRTLEARRKRRLMLHPWASAQGEDLCGVWLATERADHVFYAANTTPPHQQHIILHELAHVIWGHHGSHTTLEAARRLMPDLPLDLIKQVLMLNRTSYDSTQEQEAELLASLIGQRATLLTRTGSLGRLHTVLGDLLGI